VIQFQTSTKATKLVSDAGHIINDVVVSVQQVTELISEIAVASREQNSGVEEMNKALIQLESVTQQNAAMVEEAAAATMSFQTEANRLYELVSPFKIDEDEGPVPVREETSQDEDHRITASCHSRARTQASCCHKQIRSRGRVAGILTR